MDGLCDAYVPKEHAYWLYCTIMVEYVAVENCRLEIGFSSWDLPR